MAKNKKKPNRTNRISPYSQPPIPESPPIKKETKATSFFNKTNLVLSLILTVLTLVGLYFTFPDNFLTQKEKYKKDKFIEGTLTPPVLNNNQRLPYSTNEIKPNFQPIFIKYAPLINGIYIKDFEKRNWVFVFVSGYSFTCFKEDLKKGVDIFNPLFKDCADASLKLVVKNNRLYVSTKFKDLQKEETIGIMEYNHWELYQPNMFDYENTDKKLEVKDKQSNIVFSMEFEDVGNDINTGLINIGGYFIGDSSVIVMPNDPKKSKSINPLCLSKNDPYWKSKALYEIERIKSIFPNKYQPN